MNKELHELTPSERDLFAALSKEIESPKELEKAVIESLKDKGLIRTPRTWNIWRLIRVHPLVASIVGIAFVSMITTVVLYFPTFSTKAGMPEYILILRESPFQPGRKLSQEEFDQLTEDYDGWTALMRQRAILKEGDNLENDSRFLDKRNGEVVISREDSKDGLIIGWFIIRVQNMEAAVAVAKTCPHLKYGGRIEVREIEDPKLN